MGVCLSCRRRKGRGSDKHKSDVQLCQSLAPLHECITECGALPSGQKANTVSREQRGEDTIYRTSTTSNQCLSPPIQTLTSHPHDGPTKKNSSTFTDNVDNFNKFYICNSNGKHSIILSNGHNSTCLSATLTKDSSSYNKCDNFQSDLINVKTCARDSMTMANMKKPNLIKGLVSKKRKRFIDDDFDLDLTYITDNIIAMGLPADNIEKIYRNNIDDVARFLEGKHKDHYKIYNLCSEKSYDHSKFQNRVAVYPFDDHNPPKIELIGSFCRDMSEWLKADLSNVAAVHCKAGKGRTGTMISSYLLHDGIYHTAAEALNFYGQKRTHDSKGVTIPSQRRYVEYYAAFLRMCRESVNGSPVNPIDLYQPPSLLILKLIMTPPPILNGGQATLEFFVTVVDGAKMSLGTYEIKKGTPSICMQLDRCTPLAGDIKVEVYNTKSKIKRRKGKLFHFWFNTFFVAHEVNAVREDYMDQTDSLITNFELNFTKWELDEAHKDKQNKAFTPDFVVQVIVQRVPKSSNWGNLEHRQRSSPPSGSLSSSAEEDDSEDSLEPEENWDSGGVMREESDVLGRYRLLSEPDLEVEGGGLPTTPSSPPAAGPRSRSHPCPCPEVDAMLQA